MAGARPLPVARASRYNEEQQQRLRQQTHKGSGHLMRRKCDVLPLIGRLRAAPDFELEQVGVRALFLGIMVVYTGVAGLWGSPIYWIWAVGVPLAVAHAAHMLIRPNPGTGRRVAGIVMDQGAVIALIAVSNTSAAPLFFMSATISVGYGLRFGSRYSVLSALVAGTGFTAIALFVPAFRAEPYWMAAVIGCVALTPLYSAYLAQRLERQRQAAEDAARQSAFEAQHDALTGLANRKAFAAALADALAQTRGRRRSLAVLFIDLDGFKAVNDTMGHAAGDALLCRVARCLQGSVRAGDLVARHGGDEFLVLCRDLLRPDEAAEIAHGIEARLRTALAAGDLSAVAVAASIGVAAYTGSDAPPTANSLIEEADTAMYVAKAARRQRCAT
jgi:diguanylate cyclase (GGDEF)-like protein